MGIHKKLQLSFSAIAIYKFRDKKQVKNEKNNRFSYASLLFK